jgi:hypothetical protein
MLPANAKAGLAHRAGRRYSAGPSSSSWASTSAARLSRAMRVPSSLSRSDTPGGSPSYSTASSVPRICVLEDRPNRHRAGQAGIRGVELQQLHCLFVGHEPREASVVGIGVRVALSDSIRIVARQRDAERATFTSVELEDATSHAGRSAPDRNCPRIHECACRSVGERHRSCGSRDASALHATESGIRAD